MITATPAKRIDPQEVAEAFRDLGYLPYRGVWLEKTFIKFRGETDYSTRTCACGLAVLWVLWHMRKEFPAHWWGHKDRKGNAEQSIRSSSVASIAFELGLNYDYAFGFLAGWDDGAMYGSDSTIFSEQSKQGLADGVASRLACHHLHPLNKV